MKRYSYVFRRKVVVAAMNSGKAKAQIARDFGIAPSTLRRWLREVGRFEDESAPNSEVEDRPDGIGKIWIRGADGERRELAVGEPKHTGDPEMDRLWAMSLQELETIAKDPNHPLHHKAKQVFRDMLAPLTDAAQEALRRTTEPIAEMIKSFRDEFSNSRTINDVFRRLMPSLDVSSSVNLIRSPVTENLSQLFAGLKPQIDNIFAWQSEVLRETRKTAQRAFLVLLYPPNWHHPDISPVDDKCLRQLLREEGLVLAWTPDAGTLRLLLKAEHSYERRQVLVDRCGPIVKHCTELMAEQLSGHFGIEAAAVIEAAHTYLEGRYWGAQALATNVLDSVLRWQLASSYGALAKGNDDSFQSKAVRRTFTPQLAFQAAMVLESVRAAHAQDSKPGNDAATPTMYSRNATSHGVSPRQYSPTNALIVLMHATTIIMLFARRLELEERRQLEDSEGDA